MNTSDTQKWTAIRKTGKSNFIWTQVAPCLGVPAVISTWLVGTALQTNVSNDLLSMCLILPVIIFAVGNAAWHLGEFTFHRTLSDQLDEEGSALEFETKATKKEPTRLLPA